MGYSRIVKLMVQRSVRCHIASPGVKSSLLASDLHQKLA